MRPWQVKEKLISMNTTNILILHHYNIMNTFVGRDKIIWGTWDGDLPAEYFDVNFDLVDTTEDGASSRSKSTQTICGQNKRSNKRKI